MLQEAMRTIGFFCPSCRQAVIVERSVFQLAASQSRVACPCGAAALEVEFRNDKARLTTPCLFCEESHTVSCSAHAFLHEKAVAFSCGASGLDCCYVGEREAVFTAMSRLEETVDQLENEAAGEGLFLNETIMGEILEELSEIAQRKAVSCTCGAQHFELRLGFSAVELRCSDCGGTLKIPAATLSDMEDLCCKTSLVIRGRKS